MRLNRIAVGAMALAGAAWMALPTASSAAAGHLQQSAIPRYRHIVEIMMENTSYSTIIGSTLAPNINALARRYGATPYNHYSLLLTIEDAFRLPCLANACHAAHGVKPMTHLFNPGR